MTLLFNSFAFRQQFPLFKAENTVQKQKLIYFDNAATTQKPNVVIDAYQHFHETMNANVHRSSHRLSAMATQEFEKTRQLLATFINAKSHKEIIWTKGATESINLVAQSFALNYLQPEDEIVLSQCEHHANIVPWQIVAQQTGAVIRVLPLTLNGIIDSSAIEQMITDKTKMVCCAHISNVLGRINPIKTIIKRAKTVGAITLIDGAQAIAHTPIDVQALDCDFYVFSAHKMYGPTGVGVLYGRQALLEKMKPYQAGGEMIKSVSFEKGTTYNELPFKFEAGTPNIVGIIAFAQAISFLNQYKFTELQAYEDTLIEYCMNKLSAIPEIEFIVEGVADIPVIAFTVKHHHNQDIAASLDSYGIAIRNGHHCAMPLFEYLNITGCLRLSLAPYNTIEEIDFFIDKLSAILRAEFSGEYAENGNLLDIEHQEECRIIDANEQVSDYRESNYQKSNSQEAKQQEVDKIIALFKNLKSWDSRHRQIMRLGKELTRMPNYEKNEESLIQGCESAAWLTIVKDSKEQYHFSADSDAKVIRGLLVVVLAAFNLKTAEEIHQFNIQAYFVELGLIQHLSPSRTNGMLAIVEKILTSIDNTAV